MDYLALTTSIGFNGTSLLLLKWFATDRERGVLKAAGTSRFRLLLDARIVGSMCCFAVAAVTWMIALSGLDLCLAYASMSVIYVVLAFAGRFFFGEVITLHRALGIVLVVTGIVLMHSG